MRSILITIFATALISDPQANILDRDLVLCERQSHKSECVTWSHAGISSLQARAREGLGSDSDVLCRTLSDPDDPELR